MTTARRVLFVWGPNLSQTGRRQPEIYGSQTLAEIQSEIDAAAAGLETSHVACEGEADAVRAVHAATGDGTAAIVINPGALTHYAWSLHDALAAFEGSVIEVHLSQPATREPWRHTSVVAPVATATISGLGPKGFLLALDALSSLT